MCNIAHINAQQKMCMFLLEVEVVTEESLEMFMEVRDDSSWVTCLHWMLGRLLHSCSVVTCNSAYADTTHKGGENRSGAA